MDESQTLVVYIVQNCTTVGYDNFFFKFRCVCDLYLLAFIFMQTYETTHHNKKENKLCTQ